MTKRWGPNLKSGLSRSKRDEASRQRMIARRLTIEEQRSLEVALRGSIRVVQSLKTTD